MDVHNRNDGPVTLYPLGCQNLTRIVDAGGGYFIIGDDMRNLGLMDRQGHVVIQPMWEGVHPYIRKCILILI